MDMGVSFVLDFQHFFAYMHTCVLGIGITKRRLASLGWGLSFHLAHSFLIVWRLDCTDRTKWWVDTYSCLIPFSFLS